MLATHSTNRSTRAEISTRQRRHPLCSSRGYPCRGRNTAVAAVQSQKGVAVTSDGAASSSQHSNVPSTLSSEQQLAWQDCVQQLQGMGFGQVEAEQRVQRAFGWGAKARSYWRNQKSEQPADLQQIQAVIDFLQQQLGMTEQQVTKVVRLFPEVLGCDVQQQLQGNVRKLQQDWKLQGSVLTNAVLRNPPLLGYNVDCEGNCVGECNRCWVRF